MTKCFAFLILFLMACSAAKGETVEVTIIGHWLERNFKVTSKSDPSFDVANPKFDGKVFDLSPSDGELALTLLVNTKAVIFFPKGSQTYDVNGRVYSLAHDFYGYSDVKLVDGSYSFGGAVWRTEGVLPRLDGPNGSKATLWTDTDITKADPAKASFRMFGKAGELSADLFFGPRSPASIGSGFVLWEYYMGEEIRSEKYTVKVRSLAVP